MLVAKKKSLFDDRPMEIQELTYIIKQACVMHSCTQFLYNIIFKSFLKGNRLVVTAYKSLLPVAKLQCLRFGAVLKYMYIYMCNGTPICSVTNLYMCYYNKDSPLELCNMYSTCTCISGFHCSKATC